MDGRVNPAMVRLRWLCGMLGGLLAGVGACTGSVDEPGIPGTDGPAVNCSPGQRGCAGACIDVLADPGNCGACGKACSAEQLCDQGTCKAKAQGCSGALLACDGGCVDPQTSATHCGGCDRPCGADKSCAAGTCDCREGKSACGASCVDVQTDGMNCGACGIVCGGGRTCLQASCQCPSGRSFCGEACVDPQSNDAHCGSCGTQCSLGRICVAGECGGDGGLREDGCMGLAQGLTLRQIAVYQTVEIPLMKDGAEVDLAARNTDVVAGRDAMFRVFVDVASGFAARELSARVFVRNAASIDVYHARKPIAASSTASALDSTFVVQVPRDKVGRDTRYAVELVECGASGSGGTQSPRFPAEGEAALSARETGVLKIQLVPIQANGLIADTSEAGLQAYRALLLALYPITNVEFSVGGMLTTDDDADWNGMLDAVRAKRQADRPPADVYYYGLLKPTATLREYCGGGCTGGIGFVPQGSGGQQPSQRVALGLAFADAASAETMAHEIGHNHGRNHAPCAQGGSISGVDEGYPQANGAIGVYGWDSRTQRLQAPDRTDIMGYCANKWISDYSYDAILNRVAQVNGAMSVWTTPESLQRFRVLLLDSRGPRWGVPIDEPSPPAGEPEPAEVLDAAGRVIDTVDVYRTEVADLDAFSIQVPSPEAGWHSLRVAGEPAIVF